MSSVNTVALGTIIDEIIAPHAAEVDRAGTFPQAGIDALAQSGFLGLTSSTDVGGGGLSLAEAAEVVEAIARACSSTAMIVMMHYAATGVLEQYGDKDIRQAIAEGRHLSTLAFSEAGSRSHFWAPVSTASRVDDDHARLDARKSWVTSSGHADSYVWSSRPLGVEGPMTLWYVPSSSDGLTVHGGFDGLGLRGNASNPVTGESVEVPMANMLGADGGGLDIALTAALPSFLVLNAAFCLGVMQSLVDEAAGHLTSVRLEHLDQTLAEQPSHRVRYAEILTTVDRTRAFLRDTLLALATDRPDAMLRVLQVKAVAAEAASDVADGVMRLCGGSAFRKDLGVERRFRDALASRVMAPTTEALHDFVGRAALGQPLLGETS